MNPGVPFDLSINDGQVWLDGRFMAADVGIADGKIVAVVPRDGEGRPTSFRPGSEDGPSQGRNRSPGQHPEHGLAATEQVDARGLLVLPGLIDPHVHFALGIGETRSVDDFIAGSRAAAWGGVTSYIDFLDPVRQATDLAEAFEQRLALATGSFVDFAFHATVANPVAPALDMAHAALDTGITGIKLFTAYSASGRQTPDRYILELLQASASLGTTVLVHAENEGLMDLRPGIPVSGHSKSRPALSEITEVLKLAELARASAGRLYIVHTTCGTSLARLAKQYPELLGKRLFIESCPHYLLFEDGVYDLPDGGLFTMTPPLREAAERDDLVRRLDQVDTIGTDHCAYNRASKQATSTDQIPMGIGGIEFSFAALFDKFGAAIIDRVCANPAHIHGLWPRKGNLQPGADADIVLFDPDCPWTVAGNHGNADYSIYEGMGFTGRVRSTIASGRFLVRDRVWTGPADGQGAGRYLRRLPAQ